MYRRVLSISEAMGSRSAFLFGPRAVGKSTLLRVQFPEARVYDLLDARVYGRLLRDAHLLEEETAPGALIIVDEIQKLPALLDEVHRLIVSSERRFVLTGSSARKLKRGASNLLAGRARLLHLFPLVSAEIPHFELETYLDSGGLPLIHGDTQARQDLRSYVDLYLREEIQAEALTRNVAAFGRVLDALGVSNGQELNAAAVASDVGAQARTVLNYVEILEDTLLGFRLPAYALRGKRKSTARPKFYLFDVGVAGALAGRSSVRESPEAFGRAFEHFILLELRAALSYARRDDTLSFWRTSTGFEVDAIFGDGRVAIECKATTQVGTTHLKGLRAFREEARPLRCIVVSRDPHPRRTDDGIEILPWRNFLQEVWSGALWE